MPRHFVRTRLSDMIVKTNTRHVVKTVVSIVFATIKKNGTYDVHIVIIQTRQSLSKHNSIIIKNNI